MPNWAAGPEKAADWPSRIDLAVTPGTCADAKPVDMTAKTKTVSSVRIIMCMHVPPHTADACFGILDYRQLACQFVRLGGGPMREAQNRSCTDRACAVGRACPARRSRNSLAVNWSGSSIGTDDPARARALLLTEAY